MNKLAALFLLTIVACRPDPQIREVVITGTFKSHENPQLRILHADDGSSVSDAAVSLKINGTPINLQHNGQGFENNATFLFPNDSLELQCNLDGYTAYAQTRLPPAIEVTSISNTLITINPNSTGSPALVLQWTSIPSDQFSYVLQLEPLEPNPIAIPFNVPAGRFDVQYSGPIVQTGTILFDTDFAVYGLHRLTIYAIRKEFEALYFYDRTDLRGLALLSPDNIQNAKGFVTAISSTSIELMLQ